MKPSFHHRLINKQFDDPCLYVRMMRERRAFLFDAGFIGNLDQGDIQKITDVFVTHMHIDHFIGFDTLLRALLRRKTPLRVHGPEDIIECIEGKLKGYAWNLIKEYPFRIEAFSISKTEIRHSGFYSENCFTRTDRGSLPFEGYALKEPHIRVRAAFFSHGIPCLGFSIEEESHINIDKAKLNRMGLPIGPWLTIFKKMLREKTDMDSKLHVHDKEFRLGELIDIAAITKGQKVSYIMDISPEPENIGKAIELAKDSDSLYCEAYFLHKDIGRAFERNHITAKIAGEIARKAGVKKIIITHFSPKYIENPGEIEEEAMGAFMQRTTEFK